LPQSSFEEFTSEGSTDFEALETLSALVFESTDRKIFEWFYGWGKRAEII